MAKHGNGFYIELDRSIFGEAGSALTYHEKWLYTVLTELEARYTGGKETFFFRSTKSLAKDTGMSERHITRCKAALVKHKFISTWQMHWIDPSTGKKSHKHVSAFRVLRRGHMD